MDCILVQGRMLDEREVALHDNPLFPTLTSSLCRSHVGVGVTCMVSTLICATRLGPTSIYKIPHYFKCSIPH